MDMIPGRERIFVTGAAGMMGSYVPEVFRDKQLLLTDIRGDYERMDILNFNKTAKKITAFRPDVVLHLAAATDVDRCEKEAKWAYACNSEATKNIACICANIKAVMVYPSSGSLFSGKKGTPAIESDMPDPVNTYGKSKLEGEKVANASLKYCLIARAGWMMGGGPDKDVKFIGKIMVKILSGDKELRVIDDKFGSPTYAKDFLRGIKKLLESRLLGTYHLVNGHGCSRYEITSELVKIIGIDHVRVVPVSSREFLLSAPRALSEEIMSEKLPGETALIMRPWQEALKEYLLTEFGEELRLYRERIKREA